MKVDRMRRKCLFTILIGLFVFSILDSGFAGTTGKIAGKIIDAGSNEPVIGANIILVGTTQDCHFESGGSLMRNLSLRQFLT